MPTKITINLFAQKDFKLPRFTGHISRGIILHIIKNIYPSTAQLLHESNVLKPFAVEPVYFRSKMKDQRSYLVDSNYPIKIIVKLLDDRIIKEFVSSIASNEKILIREEELRLGEISIEQKCYNEMIERSEEINKFVIHFNTPTYFSRQKSEYLGLFPEPELMFLNVLRVWNKFSEEKISRDDFKDYKRWLSGEVGVIRYDLNTVTINAERAKAKLGFVGNAFYEINDHEYSKITHTLLSFAEFSNVGGGRTAGMGVVKVGILNDNKNNEQ